MWDEEIFVVKTVGSAGCSLLCVGAFTQGTWVGKKKGTPEAQFV